MRFSTILAPLAVAGFAAADDDLSVTTLTSTRTLTSTVTQCHSTNAGCTTGAARFTQAAVVGTAPTSQSTIVAAPSWSVANSTAALPAASAPSANFPGSSGGAGNLPPVVTTSVLSPSTVPSTSGASKGVVAMTGVVAAALAATLAAF